MPPKKAAKNHHDKKHAEKDLRRVYEHLGRVDALQLALKNPAADVTALVHLAGAAVSSGQARDAAELLRAAEHLSFALAAKERNHSSRASDEVQDAIRREFRHCRSRAEKHWETAEHPERIEEIYTVLVASADKALKQGALHPAMEFVRAAEALAHVKSPEKREKRSSERLKGAERARLAAS